ncbi:unnamed protein product [Mucor fragilis]
MQQQKLWRQGFSRVLLFPPKALISSSLKQRRTIYYRRLCKQYNHSRLPREPSFRYRAKERVYQQVAGGQDLCNSNSYDVSDTFFKYREQSKAKTKDLDHLEKYEELLLDGITLDNNSVQTDIVNYFKLSTMISTKKLLLSIFQRTWCQCFGQEKFSCQKRS